VPLAPFHFLARLGLAAAVAFTAGDSAAGVWTLRVQDAAALDTGHIDGWKLSL